MAIPVNKELLEEGARVELKHGSFETALALSQVISLKRIADFLENVGRTNTNAYGELYLATVERND